MSTPFHAPNALNRRPGQPGDTNSNLPWYCPDRDISQNFAFVIELLGKRLEVHPDSQLAAYCREEGLDPSDLLAAYQAFCRFTMSATEVPEEGMDELLRRVGYFDTSEAARMVLMANLGTLMAGVYFSGVRLATTRGVIDPCDEMDFLVRCAQRAAVAMARPRWQRTLIAWLRRCFVGRRRIRSVVAGKL